VTWFKNEHNAPDGKGEAPLTPGEALTLAAVYCGVEPTEVEAYIMITVLKCPNCGLAHNTVTTDNVDDVTAINILANAIQAAQRRLYYG
jgi:hypothetical protein